MYKGYKFDKLRYMVNCARYELLRCKLPSVKRILDVGCGFGYFLKVCEENGCRTYGLDISGYALSMAKRRVRSVLINQSAENLMPFPDCFFDAVVAIDLVDHLRKPKFFLIEVHRVLKAGGLLMVEVDNIKSLSKSIFQKKWVGYIDSTHVNLLSTKELKRLLLSAAFRRIIIETRGLPYQPIIRPRTVSNKLASKLGVIYKFLRVPLGLGDKIFAYAYKD